MKDYVGRVHVAIISKPSLTKLPNLTLELNSCPLALMDTYSGKVRLATCENK